MFAIRGQSWIRGMVSKGRVVHAVTSDGDGDSEEFDYEWRMDGEVLSGQTHTAIEAGASAEIMIDIAWPGERDNPVVTFEIDPDDKIAEVLENNVVDDWIKGHIIGTFFSDEAYESLQLSNDPPGAPQSPEH